MYHRLRGDDDFQIATRTVEYLPIATAVSRVGNDIICFRAANAHETFAVQTRTLFDEPTGCITVF